MSVFTYTALSPSGEKVSGQIEAASKAQAHAYLDARRLQPVSLAPGVASAPGSAKSASPASASSTAAATPASSDPLLLTQGQIILFTEEMADLLDAGLQLEQALQIMEKRRETSSLRAVSASVRRQVREGISFSSALRSTSRSFTELYCNLVAAGEVSGSLPQLLRQQVHFLRTMEDLRSKVIQALVYPAFIVCAGVALVMVFMTVLVPKLTMLFEKTGQSVPFLTQMLINLSRFLGANWPLLLVLLVASVTGFLLYIRTPGGRLHWDEIKLKIPLSGPVLQAHFFAQLAHTLASLITHGIPIQKALLLVTKATPNLFLRQRLAEAGEAVGEGGLLSRSLSRHPFFPPLLTDLVAVGEQTGSLGHALTKIAERYDKELNRKIIRLTSLIQPVMIVIMVLVIGLVIYSIISGIFQAVNGIRVR